MVGLDKFMKAIGLVRSWVDGTVPDYRKKKSGYTATKPKKRTYKRKKTKK